jgi:pyrimidine-specific ribonucleoside hydrolase
MLIIDSDIGSDPDDTVTLAILGRFVELNYFEDISKIVWVTSDEQYYAHPGGLLGIRAEYTRFLVQSLPKLSKQLVVIEGIPLGNQYFDCLKQLPEYEKYVPCDDLKQTTEVANSGLETIVQMIRESEEEVVYVSIGALSNLAHTLKLLGPSERERLRVYIMGGNLKNNQKVEYNIRLDPAAARYVILDSGLNLQVHIISADTTFNPRFAYQIDSEEVASIMNWNRHIGESIIKHLKVFKYGNSFMHDPLTFVTAIQLEFTTLLASAVKFVSFHIHLLNVSKSGQFVEEDDCGTPTYFANSSSKASSFMSWINALFD